MIVCRDCGQRNADADTFCGSCGRFLEWTGDRVSDPVETTALEEARADLVAPRKNRWQRMLDTVAGGLTGMDGKFIEQPAGAAAAPAGKAPGKAAPPPAPGKTPPPPPPGKAPPPPPPGKKAAPPPPPAKKVGPPPPPTKAGPPPPPAKAGPPPPPAKAGPPSPPGKSSSGEVASQAEGAVPPPPAKAGPPPPPAKVGPPPPPGKAAASAGSAGSEESGEDGSVRPAFPAPAQQQDVGTTAEHLIAGVEPGQKEAEPEEMAPAAAPAAAVRHAQRTAPSRKARPGELICGECGEGNPPARKFCRRCGESLAWAERVRVRWWRRLRWRRRAKVLKAGKRPGRDGRLPAKGRARKVFRKIRTYGFVVVLAFGLLASVYPPLRTYVTDRFDALRKQVTGVVEQTMDPARPVSVTASLEIFEHGPRLAFDQFANTYWAAPFDKNTPPSLTVDLGETTGLTRLIVTSGAAENFTALHRPSIVVLSYSNEKSDTFVLKDTPEPQEFTLANGIGAKTLRIQVLDVFPAEGAVDVALAELEFFAIV